eukprot:CAMPEP_0116888820 /NCGR_PEP_ID=MMETSP0463-20121206/24029_1 /TAXON_ID=181622 /ORGANISM="Strombidinopsis sp, Strain SopsisLIS2011" /LENGTH=63 /DNA_ID=CAMNT_0004554341 /DNA_START=432 /DNA_END=623 /DNA_ORIENTATION=+
MASKLVNTFEKPEFTLIQVEALYLDSKRPGGSPMSIGLAQAFLDKYIKGLPQDQPMPLYLVDL